MARYTCGISLVSLVTVYTVSYLQYLWQIQANPYSYLLFTADTKWNISEIPGSWTGAGAEHSTQVLHHQTWGRNV